jgi:steroid delta-isomerase-like uncharacterized protein
MPDTLAIVDKWMAAYNAGDAAAQAALYAEDASNWQHAMGDPILGRAHIEETLAAFYRAFPDSIIETEAIFAEAGAVAWFWRARGTWRGPLGGLEPNGNAFLLHGSTWFTIEHGCIVSQRAYWDKSSWFRQLGIPG